MYAYTSSPTAIVFEQTCAVVGSGLPFTVVAIAILGSYLFYKLLYSYFGKFLQITKGNFKPKSVSLHMYATPIFINEVYSLEMPNKDQLYVLTTFHGFLPGHALWVMRATCDMLETIGVGKLFHTLESNCGPLSLTGTEGIPW